MGKYMAKAILPVAEKLHKQHPFDAVLGIAIGPSTEAAIAVGHKLALPVAGLGIGTDVMVCPNLNLKFSKRFDDILEQLDLPIGVSQVICDRMESTRKSKRKPFLNYLGRDINLFRPIEDKTKLRTSLGFKKDDVIGVYVGALSYAKGIKELAEASRNLLEKHPSFKLICVGSGSADVELKTLKTEKDNGDRLLLPGLVSPIDVPKYLQVADFMVFPSYSEGMPQSVLEAMNCGLPVVATSVGGIPEAIIDGKTGLLVEAKDVKQLETAMEKLISDQVLRETLAVESAAYVESKFDPERNARLLADELLKLI
jgi:glycosyltransferase involved in cell wall biosynthesis